MKNISLKDLKLKQKKDKYKIRWLGYNGKEQDLIVKEGIEDVYCYDKNGNEIYSESNNGYWTKSKYDKNNNKTYFEDSNGYWIKREYDKSNNKTYSESSDGFWIKIEDGKKIEFRNNKYYIDDQEAELKTNK